MQHIDTAQSGHINTTPEELQKCFALQQSAFRQHPMPTLAERRQQLLKLKNILLENQLEIAQAIDTDFNGRSMDETLQAEIFPCLQSIQYTVDKLRKWMKPEKRKTGIYFWPASSRVIYQPLGVVGIISPFNYPLILSIAPMIAAMAAGNRVMLKPSELTPVFSSLLKKLLLAEFNENELAVIIGNADTASAFTRLPFDHLLFTGSTHIGRKVMQAAAENLTPLTLELGGKSPAIIAEDMRIADIIERICFAKSLNASQTCVAPDYILLPRSKQDEFITLYLETFRKMYPSIQGNPDYTSLASKHMHLRMHGLLKDAEEQGATIWKAHAETLPAEQCKTTIHLLTNVRDEMKVMQEELFVPILPVLPYDDISEALSYIGNHPRPLALYLFSNNRKLQEHVSYHTHAGTMCINEALIHLGVDDLPFGGIGQSGMGQYHGPEGFKTFSKAKSIFSKGRINLTRLFYPPYGGKLQKLLQRIVLR